MTEHPDMSDQEKDPDLESPDTRTIDPADAEAGAARPDHTGPDEVRSAGHAHATLPEESDPNADSRVGLAGGMGVSSERPGPVRGVDEEVTYGTAPTYVAEEPEGERPPEQSAYDGEPEVQPDNDVPRHPRNPQGNPGHSGG